MAFRVVPPGGHAGFNQMTPASQHAIMRGTRSVRRAARRARAPARAPARAQARARQAAPRKPKFGSPAFQKKYRVGAFAKKRK